MTSIQWPPVGGDLYEIPEAGIRNWPELRDYLIALASAQGTGAQKVGVKVAQFNPVTVDAADDAAIAVNLTFTEAPIINLPVGTQGQVLRVFDAKGDAKDNNITINAAVSTTINGQASVTITTNYGGLALIKIGTDWKIENAFTGIDGIIPFWLEPVDTLADLPVSGEEGQFVYVKTPGSLYTWNGSSWVVFSGGGGGGGSGVDAVNGQVGVVVLDADDISETATNRYFTPTRESDILAYADQVEADAVAAASAYTDTKAQEAYDDAVADAATSAALLYEEKLPDQTGQTGKVLGTDGTDLLWVAQSGGGGATDTDGLPEGAVNLYFTNERAQDAVGAALTDSASVDFSYSDAGNTITATVIPSGVEVDSLAATAPLSIAKGGTGAATAPNARTALGLGNVDNTSDANKPVSTAQQAALDLKIPLTQKGAVNGVASLGADGLVPLEQLPAMGGGSGITTVERSANFTITNATRNLVNSNLGSFTGAAPTGSSGAYFEVWDAGNSASVNPIILTPPSGKRFENCAIDEPFIINESGAEFAFAWSVAAQAYMIMAAGGANTLAVASAGISGKTKFDAEIGSSTSNPIVTYNTRTGQWYQVGDQMVMRAQIQVATYTAGSGALTVKVPGGYRIDLDAVTGSGVFSVIGSGSFYDSSANTSILLAATVSAAQPDAIQFIKQGGVALTSLDFGASDQLGFVVTMPILEWANQNTVLMNPGAFPVYASNSSTTTANDTSSFQYGESGASVQAFAPTGSVAVTKRVRSPFPNPKFSMIQVKVPGRPNWINLADTLYAVSTDGSSYFGMELVAVSGSTTDFDVRFYSRVNIWSGNTWAAETTGLMWRVVFANSPMAVGIQKATADTEGLISKEELSTHVTNVSGPFATNSVTIHVSKIGRQVTLTFPDVKFNGNSTSAPITFSTNLPAKWAPIANIRQPMSPVLAGANTTNPGMIVISTTGSILAYVNLAAADYGPSTGTQGFSGVSISYISAT